MKISVIVPCRDGEAFLEETLRSLTRQTLPPDEILVVDDGSSDRSLPIAQQWGDAVRCLQAGGEGASAARNLGAAAAHAGNALMFLDADDLLAPNVLGTLAAGLQDHPDAIACCPWFRLELRDGCWISRPASCAPRAPWQDDLSAWLTGWYHPPCSLLWSRSAYARSGGWNPAVMVNTDGDIMMRALINGVRLLPIRGAAAYYRRLPGDNMSLSERKWTRIGAESRFLVLEDIAERLRQRGVHQRYATFLGEAFDSLASGLADRFSDLYSRTLAHAQSHGGHPEVRALRQRIRRAGARVSGMLERFNGHVEIARPCLNGSAALPRQAGSVILGPAPPTVSVIIPTYNRKKLLARAIDSVLGQAFADFELIVVDDGSTDGTGQFLRCHGDPRIRCVRQANAGVAAARNRGIREARGRYFALLDSDDEWLPEKLALQVELFESGPDRLGLVYTGVESVRNGQVTSLDIPTVRGHVLREMLVSNVIHGGGSNAMIRRDVISTIGLFDEHLPAMEDYEFFLRISRFYEIDFVPAPLIRFHNDDVKSRERRSLDFAANMRARDIVFTRNRHEMRQAGVEHLFLAHSARRHLRSLDGSWRAAAVLAAKALAARPLAGPVAIGPLLPAAVRGFAKSLLRGSDRRTQSS